MADRNGLALLARTAQSHFELFADREHFSDVVEEWDVPEGLADSKVLRCVVSHRSRGGAAVHVKVAPVAQPGHQFIHQCGVSGGLCSLMVVKDAGIWNILQTLVDYTHSSRLRRT